MRPKNVDEIDTRGIFSPLNNLSSNAMQYMRPFEKA